MEIHRADPAYRRRSLAMLAVATALCAVLLWQLHAWLQELTARLAVSDADTLRRSLRALLAGLGVALAVPAAAVGLQLWRFGEAAHREGRFPPAEARTLRDVRVLRGPAALAWARRTRAAGVAALALSGVLFGWAGWAWWRYG